MPKLNYKNNAYTYLSEHIDDIVLQFGVADAGNLPEPPFRVTIDNEIIEVRSKEGNLLKDVMRGMEGTLPSSHKYGSLVENRLTVEFLNNINTAIDEGTNPDFIGVRYKLIVKNGKPYLKILEV